MFLAYYILMTTYVHPTHWLSVLQNNVPCADEHMGVWDLQIINRKSVSFNALSFSWHRAVIGAMQCFPTLKMQHIPLHMHCGLSLKINTQDMLKIVSDLKYTFPRFPVVVDAHNYHTLKKGAASF